MYLPMYEDLQLSQITSNSMQQADTQVLVLGLVLSVNGFECEVCVTV